MVLRNLKKGGERSHDVRSFNLTPERKATEREKFTLSKEDFDMLLVREEDEPQQVKINVALQLIMIFPKKEAEIISRLGLKRITIIQSCLVDIQSTDSLFHKLHAAASYKLFLRNNDILEKLLPPEEYALEINKQMHAAYVVSAYENIFYLRRCFKMLFPELDRLYFDDEQWWLKARDFFYVANNDDTIDINRRMSFLGDLKIIEPKRMQEFYTPALRAQAIARLDDFKREHGSFRNIDISDLLDLIILDADEVKIDATGLHIINYPAPESLEAAVPEQPESLNIN